MERVGGEAVSCDFTIDFRAARFGVLEFFHDNNSGAFANNKAVAITVERAGGAFGFVVAVAQRFHS